MMLRDFQLRKDDVGVLTACLELVAFSETPIEEGASGFAAFYSAFQKLFGNKLTLYNTANMKRMQAIDRKVLDMVPFWFSGEPGVPSGNLSFYAHSGKTSQDAVPPAFEMFCDRTSDTPNSFFRMVLPTDWLSSAPTPLLQLTLTALQDFPLSSGYAGYSLFWRVLDPEIIKLAALHYKPWLKRHPGFVHGDTMEFCETALMGIITADWLTLLGPKYTKKLGGPSKIQSVLGPDIGLHPIGKGLVIQAGPQPQIGDVNRKDRIPAYCSVAKVLKKLRAPAEEAWIEGFDTEELEAWFARFDN